MPFEIASQSSTVIDPSGRSAMSWTMRSRPSPWIFTRTEAEAQIFEHRFDDRRNLRSNTCLAQKAARIGPLFRWRSRVVGDRFPAMAFLS